MLDYKQIQKIKKCLKSGKRIVDIHPKQKLVYDDPSPRKVICAGRGFGKSILMILLVLKYVIANPGSFAFILSPVIKQGERNLWKDFKKIWNLLYEYGKYESYGIIAEFYSSDSKIVFKIPVINDEGITEIYESEIVLESAFNPDRLLGTRLNFLGVDEFRAIDNKDDLWESVEGALMPDSQVVIISTMAKEYDRFYEFIQWGEDPAFNEWKSWKFNSVDNVTVEGWQKTVENKKKYLSKETFEREYESNYIDVTGNICSKFKRTQNVVNNWEIFPDKTFNISTDFNVNCMTSIIFQVLTKQEILNNPIIKKELDEKNIKPQDENIFVFKEFKFADRRMELDDFSEEIKNYLIETKYNVEKYGLNWYGDPHGHTTGVTSPRDAKTGDIATAWSIIEKHFPTANFYNDKFENQKNRADNFKDKLINYLLEIGIFINQNCEELIKDIEQVKWDETGQHIDKRQERKHIGHLFDCITYSVSYDYAVNQPEINISGINIPSFQYGYSSLYA